MAGSEQEPKTLIGQLRQDLRAIDMRIMMLSNTLDEKNGASVDQDYRPTTQIWVAEHRGARNYIRCMLGEMTFEEMMEDAEQRTIDRYFDGLVSTSGEVLIREKHFEGSSAHEAVVVGSPTTLDYNEVLRTTPKRLG